jgi:hypothetical protein
MRPESLVRFEPARAAVGSANPRRARMLAGLSPGHAQRNLSGAKIRALRLGDDKPPPMRKPSSTATPAAKPAAPLRARKNSSGPVLQQRTGSTGSTAKKLRIFMSTGDQPLSRAARHGGSFNVHALRTRTPNEELSRPETRALKGVSVGVTILKTCMVLIQLDPISHLQPLEDGSRYFLVMPQAWASRSACSTKRGGARNAARMWWSAPSNRTCRRKSSQSWAGSK